MTVTSTANKSGPYELNGVTTTFPRTFRIGPASDMKVIRIQDGIETVLTTGFTITDTYEDTGNVIFSPALNGGELVLLRSLPLTQGTDYSDQARVAPSQVEADLDKAVMLIQDMDERLDRAAVLPVNADPAETAALVVNIQRLGDSADNIDTVAGMETAIGEVAAVSGFIQEVAELAPLLPGLPAQIEEANAAADRAEAAASIVGRTLESFRVGAMSDTETVQAAVTWAEGEDGRQVFGAPGAVYTLTATIAGAGAVRVVANGARFVMNANLPAFEFFNPPRGPYALTANYGGSTTLTVADTGTAFAPGTKIKIISNALDRTNRDEGATASAYRTTDWAVVGVGSTTTSIVLQRPLTNTIGIVSGSRVPAYTTALGARVIALNAAELSLEDMDISYTPGQAWTASAVSVIGYDAPRISRMKLSTIYGSGLATTGCYRASIDLANVNDAVVYGIADQGSFGTVVNTPTVNNTRHGFTTTASTATTGSTVRTLLAAGITPSGTVINGIGTNNPLEASWDTHHDARDCSFINCTSIGGASWGANARGRNINFLNHTVRNCGRGIISLTEYDGGDGFFYTNGKLAEDMTSAVATNPDIECDLEVFQASAAFLTVTGGRSVTKFNRGIRVLGGDVTLEGTHRMVIGAGTTEAGAGFIEMSDVASELTTAFTGGCKLRVAAGADWTIDARNASVGASGIGVKMSAGSTLIVRGILRLLLPPGATLLSALGTVVTEGSGVIYCGNDIGTTNVAGRAIHVESEDGTTLYKWNRGPVDATTISAGGGAVDLTPVTLIRGSGSFVSRLTSAAYGWWATDKHLRLGTDIPAGMVEFWPNGALVASVRPTGIRAVLPTYADNAAALAGGLVAGDMYKTAAGDARITV